MSKRCGRPRVPSIRRAGGLVIVLVLVVLVVFAARTVLRKLRSRPAATPDEQAVWTATSSLDQAGGGVGNSPGAGCARGFRGPDCPAEAAVATGGHAG